MLINKIVQLSNKFEKMASTEGGIVFEVDKHILREISKSGERDVYEVRLEKDGKKFQGKISRLEDGSFKVDELFKLKPEKEFTHFSGYDFQKKLLSSFEKENIIIRMRSESPSDFEERVDESSAIAKLCIKLLKKEIHQPFSKSNFMEDGSAILARPVKESIARRKKAFELAPAWKAVTDTAGSIGKTVQEFGEGAAKRVQDLFKSDEEKAQEEKAKKEQEAKGKQEKQESSSIKEEKSSQSDDLYYQTVSQWKNIDGEAQQNPPPENLKNTLRGYRRVTSVPSNVAAEAKALLSKPYWSTKSIQHEGVWYLALVEWHYDDHVDGILRWHKGVSVFAPIVGGGKDTGEVSTAAPIKSTQIFLDKEEIDKSVVSEEFLESNPFNAMVLSEAISDLGVKETGPVKNSGQQISNYFKALNINLPPNQGLEWCAAACSYWLKKAGLPLTGSASSMELAKQFKNAGALIEKSSIEEKDLIKGNVVFWDRGSGNGHVGVIYNYDSSQITTIDGNSGRSGKEVAVMQRNPGSIYAIGSIDLLLKKALS